MAKGENGKFKGAIKGAFMHIAVIAVTMLLKILPWLLIAITILNVLFNRQKEIIQSENTMDSIYDILEMEDLNELIEKKGNDSTGYYWGLVDGADEKLDKVIDELGKRHNVVSINSNDLLKRMIIAQVVTQYPDLGGKSFITDSLSDEGGDQNVCEIALSQLDKPYVVSAYDPDIGFDCSGLVVWAYRTAGYDWGAERLTANRFSQVGREISREELKPGDVICEGWDGSKYGHIVIYIGNNEVVASEAICSLAWNKHRVGSCTSGCKVRRRPMNDAELNGTGAKYITLSDYYTGSANITSTGQASVKSVDEFQGAIHLRRVMPDKEIGKLEDVSTGVTTQKETLVVAESFGLGTKEDISERVKNQMEKANNGEKIDISYDELSYLTIPYYYDDGKSRKGHMVVDKELADEVLLIFQEIYKMQYQIKKMDLIEELKFEKNNVVFEAEINSNSEISKIFEKYGWKWKGKKDDSKDYYYFEKEDPTSATRILSINVTDDEENDEDNQNESQSDATIVSGNTDNNAGIRSKIYDLKYVSKELFDKHIEEGNKQALQEFTIDEDDSNKMVIATWSYSSDGNIKLSEKKFEASNSYTQKYTMPIEYLLDYYIDTRNEEFITDLANLAIGSEFVLAVQDNITTTKTEVYKTVEKRTYEDTYKNLIDVSKGKTIKESSEVSESVSTSIELTYGNTWFLKFYKDINYSSEDLNSSSNNGRVNTVQNINGNVQSSNNSTENRRSRTTYENKDDRNFLITTTTITTTNVDTISYKYNSGETHVLGNEQKFIKIYKKNEDFRTSLKPEWLFTLLEKSENTTNMIDLTKYLLYLSSGQKNDYGVTKFDFSEYKPEDFSKISSGVFGSDILLDFLKSWENPTVWYYQTDKIGYSGSVTKYITQDKTKYICFDDGLNTRNFGFGVCHYYSGHYNNQGVYASVGVDITQYYNIGSTLDVDIVDKVKLLIVKNNRDVINSNLAKAGISLEENQLQALDAICYQWGPYGTINDFISAYQKYGDTEALRQNFTHHGDKPFLSGDNGRAYEIKRANANWTLFHEGRYLTSDGGELNPNDYTFANVGEIASIPLEQRMSYVFPNGVPNSQSGMSQYLTTITVPINNSAGVPTTTQITCNKAIADELVAIFTEMQAIGFKITDAYSYSWRSMASGTGSLSHHSYGLAIDINASANPASYWGYKPDPNSPYYINEQIVNIWKAHGFYWGGDWSPSYYDPMHFSYTNH